MKKKAITFIRGTVPKQEGIQIFEGMMDCLSVIERQRGENFDGDTIILNSLSSCIREAIGYIHNYGYRSASMWMDNDKAGEQATQSFAEYFMNEKISCAIVQLKLDQYSTK